MLNVRNLSKAIDGKTILENINFELKSGSITGLIGRNGVGKSTLLRIMTGILDPDQGEVLFEGVNLRTYPLIKQSMYYVPDSMSMFNSYSVKELVRLHRSMYEQFDQEAFYTWLDRFQLPTNRTLRSFSKGMKALLVIILALATQSKLIILDEPTNGLDVIVKKQVMQLLVEEVSERQLALIISSHHLQELEKIADVVMMMKDTRIDSMISIEDVKQSFKKVQVAFADVSTHCLFDKEYVEVLSQVGRVTTLLIKSNAAHTIRLLQDNQPLLLEELPVTVEDLFMSRLGGNGYVS
ncbi:ABC transporter ATP-binding protein [Paenibacillus periandrae]|uniref:ABC transporter ATP-binding protein n=1 Tax=Paenibacillus periandrae TaxID=1761741 RepID=UPI001F08B20E|nr:ABC transporter ATP-binding protein [Paenibacillus periandrae]